MAEDKTEATEVVDTVSKAEYDGLLEKYRKEQAKAVDYERRYKGVDLDALKAKAEERDILAAEGAKGDPNKVKAEIDRAVHETRKQLQKELDERDQLLGKLKGENKELRVVDRVFAEAAGKFIDKAHGDLKRVIRESGDLDDEGNIVFKDSKGEILYSKKNRSETMGVEEFIEALCEEKPHWAADFQIAGAKSAGEKRGAAGGAKVTSLAQLSAHSPEKQREILNSMEPQDVAKLLSGVRVS